MANLAACLLAVASSRAEPPEWDQQPAPQKCLAGESVRLKAATLPGAPVVWKWHHDAAPFPGADTGVLYAAGSAALAGDWQAVVRSAAGETWSAPAPLGVVWPSPAPGVVDGAFVPQPAFRARFHAVFSQSGGLVAAGEVMDAASGAVTAGCFVRMDGNGATTFLTQPDGAVRALAAAPAGGFAAAGDFTQWEGQGRPRLVFLSADGRLLPPGSGGFVPSANGTVHCLLPLPDGRLLIGGVFDEVNGTPRPRLARLLADGLLDAAFQPPALNGGVFSLLDGGNGRVIIGGAFTGLGQGGTINRLARLNADGSLDAGFAAAGGATGEVLTLARQAAFPQFGQPESRIVAGGAFLRMHGQSRLRLARLKEDGSLDTAFRADADAPVRAVLPEAPGGIVVAGDFVFLKGRSCSGLARLAPNGTGGVVFESTFRPPALDYGVRALAAHGAGSFAAAGDFTLPRKGVMRVWSTTPPAEPPQILALPAVVDAVVGGPLEITPTVRGYPAPVLRWYRAGVLTSARMDKVSLTDDGVWTLEAQNNGGTVSRSFVVNVRRAPWPGESPRRAWSWSGPLDVPDQGQTEAPLTVADGPAIHRLRVSVDLKHVETGDLTVSLIAPDGTTVVLLSPQRRIGWDLAGTTFDDDAAMSLRETADPHPGGCLPASPLSAFRNLPTTGTWRLRVLDPLPDGVAGTLKSWRLEVDSGPVVQSFTAWAAASLPAGDYPDPAADPDGNGVTLFQDYALGGATPGVVPVPGGDFELLLNRPAKASDLLLFGECSDDLRHWIPFYGDAGEFTVRTPDGRDQVRLRIRSRIGTMTPQRFYRFKAQRM